MLNSTCHLPLRPAQSTIGKQNEVAIHQSRRTFAGELPVTTKSVSVQAMRANRCAKQIRLAFGSALLGVSLSGMACKFQALSLEDSVGLAQTVFVARAQSSSNDRSGQGPSFPASMRVLQVVKGTVQVGRALPVYTDNSSCGLAIQRGQLWLILASGEPLRSDLPSGSMLLADQAARNLVSKKLGLKLQ